MAGTTRGESDDDALLYMDLVNQEVNHPENVSMEDWLLDVRSVSQGSPHPQVGTARMSRTDPARITESLRRFLRRQHHYFVDDVVQEVGEGEGNSLPGGPGQGLPGPCISVTRCLRGCHRIHASAVNASSTDHPSQKSANVLRNDTSFWSSTGSADGACEEHITLKLSHLSRVRGVALGIFRAFFQFGEPIYPPRAVSIAVGATPSSLVTASPKYRVELSEDTQLFMLFPSAPPARYIRITFHGSLQRQLEDGKFYVAIRFAALFGVELDQAKVTRLNGGISPAVGEGGQMGYTHQRWVELEKCRPSGREANEGMEERDKGMAMTLMEVPRVKSALGKKSRVRKREGDIPSVPYDGYATSYVLR